MIAPQLGDARARFTAIGPGHHGDSRASQPVTRRPAWLLMADIRTPATAGTGPAETTETGGRPAAAAQASPARGPPGSR
jgi:hypothetical protein